MIPEELVKAAKAVRERAYAPYSGYRVGAALLDADGQIHIGCNVENASYGLTICAERAAVLAMVAAGAREPRALALVTRDGGSPCGACRQVLREFSKDLLILILDEKGGRRETRLGELLPDAFGPENL